MTFSKHEIRVWCNKFDTLQYPTKIYDELVWGTKKCPNQLELLGAWKTGCIRINNSARNPIYIDENNTKYEYTGRWQPHTPVGFDIWKNLSIIANEIYAKIPSELQKTKPNILTEMEEKRGFGFIWGLFILHCFYPEVYPLYDQHVYRAYMNIQNPHIVLPSTASTKWTKYLEYANFFNSLTLRENFRQVEIDRALWAYGKYLKINSSSNCTKDIPNATVQSFVVDEKDDGYCLAFTLGGKHKRFWWKIDENCSITIIRKFNSGSGKITLDIFTEKEIENIQQFINGNKIPLANNVEKIKDGTEKEGLGRFLYEQLNKNTTQAQLASHISAIFYYAGIWDYNRQVRNMLFWNKSKDWKNLIKAYCHICLNGSSK
ncbi:MAG: hypothetical protein DRG30_06035 [Epsilonproteobacteria bacterium]|nr:MAG: hypothetical protein DRG30_06035 [Campylobacterota bacterium]